MGCFHPTAGGQWKRGSTESREVTLQDANQVELSLVTNLGTGVRSLIPD